MNKFEIWIEGYSATGQRDGARRLGDDELFEGVTFKDACKNALLRLKWNMSNYNEANNSYWACRFYDNEIDARKAFG